MSDGRCIRDVVILGGGTAGWMAACYLSKALQEKVSITVCEAPSIPTIGVGEATVPNLQRVFFDYLEIPEEQWMKACNASFKIAVRFVNWRTCGAGQANARTKPDGRSDHFYHPFGLLPECDRVPLSHYWAKRSGTGDMDIDFGYACFREPPLMDAMLAPKTWDGTPITRYAWHFDASLVAAYLCEHGTRKQGVRHVQEVVEEVKLGEDGFVTGLRTASGRVLRGDLFIDCSGFKGTLINEAMAEPFLDMSDYLLCDSAVAGLVPNDDEANGVEPYTSALAMSSGWTWKIPLLGRFGSGYVYSSQFATADEATLEFSRLWGLDPEAEYRHIRFRVGRNRRAWVKNVVSIGLASCFLEPLESTGIYFITASLYQLVKHFPDRRFDPVLIREFNREIELMFDDTRDFIQAHFSLAPRTDTPFWRETKSIKLADSIADKLARYKSGMIINQPVVDERIYYSNFDAEFRNFWTNGSYFSIFSGLGVNPGSPLPVLNYRPSSLRASEKLFEEIRAEQRRLVEILPTNYEYLCRLHGLKNGC